MIFITFAIKNCLSVFFNNEIATLILTVSKTFKDIEMTCNGKPSAVRAQVGRNFKNQIGHGDFSNIRRAYHDNKKPKLSKNNAIVYEII